MTCVHQRGEGTLAASDVFGQGHAGVVAGLDDHALEQILHADPLANFDKHARAPGAPGLFAHEHLVLELDIALGDLPQHRVGGHDLGQAGGFQAGIRIGLGQHPAAVHVDQQVAAAGHRRGGGDGYRGLGRGGQPQAEQNGAETIGNKQRVTHDFLSSSVWG